MKILPSFLASLFLVGAATLASADTGRKGGDERTPEERAALRFDRIDTNSDGVISRDEFVAAHLERMNHRKDHKDHKGAKDAQETKDAKAARKAKKAARKAARKASKQDAKLEKTKARKATKRARAAVKVKSA